jgi:dynein heavy chain
LYKKKIETFIQVVEQRADKLNDRDRKKVETMIIMEEHNRDVIDKLFANKQIHAQHFEWLSQLRYEREPEGGSEQMVITCEQLNFQREYGYEYQGNNGRLVVTGLTDKAYMTLTNALHMFKGGAPQGPAGTGKTETTKDLGKNLATYVVIQNCSDQMDHNSLGTNFCGLAMEGVWGCFDEFNRITLDVLSVITTMIKDILDSIKKGNGAVNIGDAPAFIAKPNTGLFITMNPGYAGRTELPDNLASLFRPVAMMVPDFFAIAKYILMSKGFQKNEELSKKICTVYDLMQRQLSRQDFYDFSTRAVKSCVLACGNIKRKEPNQDEVKIVLKAIRDMNLPKLVFEDVSLFDNLFMDLFPEIEEPEIDNDAL